MIKTTVYLPEELDLRLEAVSASSGVSKAELIRRGVSLVLDASGRPEKARPLPVFNSGQRLTPEDMERLIHDRVQERARRR
jgi:Arc/MetJ-type ribon-helix-helix transcriptional regulator